MVASAQEKSLERAALLALWAVPGIGPKTLDLVRSFARGELAALVDIPLADWLEDAPLPSPVKARLGRVRSLEQVAERVLARCEAAGMGVAFAGEPAFPARLAEAPDSPPLLFYRGRVGLPRRRVAMVGSRHPDQGFLPLARSFARDVAAPGVGVVSGAAAGVDRACHWGALDCGGETWAFLGSALDELDDAQAQLLPHFLDGAGVYFSELPPGVRASRTTFPRRNRLIAGASDAVLVMRAGLQSGSIHTARAGLIQGRPVLALPGEIRNDAAAGCNDLIRAGVARACLKVEDVWEAVGIQPDRVVPARDCSPWEELSAEAKVAFELLERAPRGFEEVLAGSELSPAALTSALVELELAGWVVQLPGKLYEKV